MVVDRWWTARISAAFTAADDVACVTGLIFPAELRTAEQWWIERAAGFAKGFAPRLTAEMAKALGPLPGAYPDFEPGARPFNRHAMFTWNDFINFDYDDPTPPNTNNRINVHDWLDGASAPPSPISSSR